MILLIISLGDILKYMVKIKYFIYKKSHRKMALKSGTDRARTGDLRLDRPAF